MGYELISNLDFDNLRGSPSIWSEDCTDGACQTATAVDGDNADKVGWAPIRGSFTATFDGNNYAISNLYIHRSRTSYVGLFGALGTEGNLRNLGIEGGSLRGADNVGGLVGRSNGTISDCHATGDVMGSGVTVGGLVGWNNGGTITNGYAMGNVTGSGNNVGGLTGSNEGGAIANSYATGTVTGSGGNVGGLAGVSKKKGSTNATISACYATGNATGRSTWVGGLVGQNDSGTISACYATGDATGTGGSVGGLLGLNDEGTISACYATGNASGDFSVGGLVGASNAGTIRACYATGNANGSTYAIAGLVGGSREATISACYSTGNASGNANVGGLLGVNQGNTVTNSYFDSNVSNRTDSDDYAKTTTDLQTPTAYDGNADATDGSSIYETWNIDVDDGQLIGVDDGTMAGDDTVDDPWEFGTASQYPALRVDFDVDGAPSVVEFGMQPRTSFRVSSFTPERGIVGAMVTITGRGFSETATDNTVTFLGAEGGADDVEAMVSAASTTELTVTVPDGAMTGRIQVAVSGEMASSTTDFRVLILSPYMDADGLIDVTTLAQLDAIRYDLDGDGRPTSAGQMAWQTAFLAAATVDDDAAVPDVSTGFTGYELRSNLDFNNVGGSPSIWSENCADGACQTATAVDGDNADKVGWAPIGYWNSSTDNAYYTATFDGRGHTISNLYINRSGTDNVGLFGVLGTGGNVRNLRIEGGSVTGDGLNIGGLVGYNDFGGTISACYATGNASGGGIVGGLVGRSYGTISACYATGDATGTGDYVGGLVGRNTGTISACYASGSVNGDEWVGGLVGYNDSGTISACYATGDVTGTNQYVGGLVGFNEGPISACYATGNVSGNNRVGGLVGNNGGTISACYATGNATGTGSNFGGLVGANTSPISACYATGDASGSSFAGGLVGANTSTISACYATGNATATDSGVGGLVGLNSGTITNSYFDSTVSNRTDTDNYSKTTTDLQTPTAYGTAMEIYANWNIDVDNGADAGIDDGTMPGDAAADDPWDFGTDSQYPVLRVDFNVSGSPTAFEFGGQGRTVPATVPDALAALTATAANAEVTLSWTAAASGDGAPITGYMIDYSVSADFSSPPTTRTTAAAATSYTVSGLTNGTLYYFRVAAVNAAGTAAYYPGMGDAAVSATPATVPAAPSALLAMAANAAVTLNWTAAVNDGGAAITGYMIEHSLMVDFSSPTTATTMNDATSYTVSGLTNGTPYYFRVAAVNAAGTSAYYPGAGGTAVSATPAPTVPSAPSALTAMAADAAVTLNWTAAASDGGAPITGYMLEYDTDMNFPSPTPATTAAAATSHTVSALTNATPYYFRVAAVNSVGTGAYYPGATDAAVSATPAPTAPSAPSALMAAAANTAVTLSWTAPTSDGGAPIINYMVEYDTDMNFSSSPTTVPTAADATSHTISGLTNGTLYYFRVAAVNSVGTGAYYPGATDAAVSATPAPTAPAAPSALMAMAANAAVTLSWTAPTSDGGAPIINYMVEYDTDMNFSSSPTTVPTVTAATSHTVSALTNATPYYFRVAAVNAAGTGAYYPGATDAAVSATPAPTAPAAPSALMATAANAAVTLNWTAPTSDGGAAITDYMIEYDTDMNFSSSPTTVSTATAATSHTVSALTNATPYYFRVAAVNAAGTGAYYPGATDAAVSATPAPTAPAAPSALMATAANAAVTLNWTAPTSDGGAAITDYMIEYDTDMNFSSSPTTVSTATAATSHTVSTLTNATPYYFRVAAVNAVGTGAYYPGATDAAVSATPAPTAPTAPAAPSALMAAAANAAVTLNWTAPTSDGGAAITGYMVEYDTDMNFSSSPTTVPTATAATSYIVSALTNATPYYFRVAAVNAAGTGAYYPGATDAAVSATPAPAPAAPVVSSFSPTEGEVDTEVTITGVNFSATPSANEVRFGGVMAADPTSASTTSLVVLVPSGAVTGSISVAVGGQTGTSSENFTVKVPAPAPAAPVVSSFSPTEGEVDTEVTITGVNFSATPSANEVRFGGVMSEDPTSASTTSLVVLVPSGAVTGRISVAVGGQTGTSSENFTVTAPAPAPAAPVVSSFSPTEGEVDTEVTITGVNFSDMSSENEVRFGGVMAAAPTSASTTSLTVLVPSGAVTGRISVAVGGQTGTSSTDFTVTGTTPAPEPPVVSSFTPTEGEVGTSVTITGENFSDMPSANEVKFGGVMAAAPTSASTTSLTVLVPSGARTGSISVTVGGQTGTSSESFTVTAPAPAPAPPVVSSFTPSEGVVGTSVTITGDNFSATPSENEVRFGGVMAAEPTSASTTSLTILVPSGARTGRISVAVGGQTGTSSTNFTVTAPAPAPAAPVVSSFSPYRGRQ